MGVEMNTVYPRRFAVSSAYHCVCVCVCMCVVECGECHRYRIVVSGLIPVNLQRRSEYISVIVVKYHFIAVCVCVCVW